MSKTVHVELGARSYNIRVGAGLTSSDFEFLKEGSNVLIISDSNVDPLLGESLEKVVKERGVKVKRAVIPAGEESKDISQVMKLYDVSLSSGLDRSSTVLALGGGVVGDIAGFVSATYMRGIKYVQIPTTLLAMVDSAVGGKTGINLPAGKNLVGSFHQPVAVLVDLGFLDSLPERQYVSGLAEVVKYGVIWDAEFLSFLESHADAILKRDHDTLESVVARCCEIKAEVVAVDEMEGGVRAVLNFGHTFGHALEKVTGYGKMLHGEAVSVGMVYSSILSSAVKGLSDAERERLISLIKKLGLPAGIGGGRAEWKDFRDAIASDKKKSGSVPRFVLAERLGAVIFGCEVEENEMKKAFDVMPK